MRTSKYSEEQIIGFLRQAEAGMPIKDIGRKHGFSDASFYKWRAKFGGMDFSLMARMKVLEDENRRLKNLYIYAQKRALIVEEALAKNSPAISATGDGQSSSRPARCTY